MIKKIIGLILFIILFISLMGAYEGILAFFLLLAVIYGFIAWYYWDEISQAFD